MFKLRDSFMRYCERDHERVFRCMLRANRHSWQAPRVASVGSDVPFDLPIHERRREPTAQPRSRLRLAARVVRVRLLDHQFRMR